MNVNLIDHRPLEPDNRICTLKKTIPILAKTIYALGVLPLAAYVLTRPWPPRISYPLGVTLIQSSPIVLVLKPTRSRMMLFALALFINIVLQEIALFWMDERNEKSDRMIGPAISIGGVLLTSSMIGIGSIRNEYGGCRGEGFTYSCMTTFFTCNSRLERLQMQDDSSDDEF
jgi:hypothetical protein